MFEIRDLRQEDIPAIADIVKMIWGDSPSTKVELEANQMFVKDNPFPPHYFVATIREKVVGFTGLRPCLIFPDTFECIWINVHPDYQFYGIGKELNLRRISKFEELGGKVLLVMTKQPGFFDKFNFQTLHNFGEWKLMMLQTGTLKL